MRDKFLEIGHFDGSLFYSLLSILYVLVSSR